MNNYNPSAIPSPSDIDFFLQSKGLVDLRTLIPSLHLDIPYQTSNNFTGKVLYERPFGPFCEPETALRVAAAARKLSNERPGYGLVVFDAVRPYSVQKKMFESVRGTNLEKYVAEPTEKGGFHNYGLAVDLSLVAPDGSYVDMGTDFDAFTSAAHTGIEAQLLAGGEISKEAFDNRIYLYNLMASQGLIPHPFEWWHYQYYNDESDKDRFELIDFNF